MKISGNKILITGGATGIGFGLTERFLAEGNDVIICGRREEALREAKEKLPQVMTKVCDLSVSAERESLRDWVAAEHSDLNVLVNNAGVQQYISVTDEDFYERAKAEIVTNIEAPIHLSALFLKLESLQTIVNVTSGLSFVPFAKVPVYSATKAFFHSFTVSLRHNLQAQNVEVIEIIPPAINTDLGGKGLHDYAPPVSEFIASVFEQLKAGETEITFGMSEKMARGTNEEREKIFATLNPSV